MLLPLPGMQQTLVEACNRKDRPPEDPDFLTSLREVFIKPARDLALLRRRSGSKFYSLIFNRLESKEYPVVTAAFTWALNPYATKVVREKYGRTISP